MSCSRALTLLKVGTTALWQHGHVLAVTWACLMDHVRDNVRLLQGMDCPKRLVFGSHWVTVPKSIFLES